MFGIEGLTGTLLFTILVAAFGSAFQHGYNSGVVNAPEMVIENWLTDMIDGKKDSKESKTEVVGIYSIIVAIYGLGGMIGGMMTKFWANTFGIKWGIMSNNVFILVAAALMGFSKMLSSYHMLIVGRFIAGINSGLNAGLVPMYLSEIPPTSLRGGVSSVYQLFLTISILLSQILSSNQMFGTENQWPILFGLVAIPAIVQLILLPLCADSPRYLQTLKKDEDAKNALRWFRGNDDVQKELDVIKDETDSNSKAPKVTIHDLFTDPVLRKPLVISCMIMISQQFSGINAVIFYSTSSFVQAQLSEQTAQLGTIMMGVMNVAMTVLSTLLVDKAGRKTLLSLGFGLMFFDTILLFICLTVAADNKSMVLTSLSILLVVLFVVFFAIGPGSIPWFLVTELFLPNARPLATSFAVPTNWLANTLVLLTFPTLQKILEAKVFIIFAVFQMLFLIYIILAVPETKNRDIADIHTEFEPKKG